MYARDIYISILSILVFVLSGCQRQIDYFSAYPVLQFTQANSFARGDLVVLAKAMQPEEITRHFGVNFSDKGYLPIHLRIINTGAKNYTLSPNYIALPLVSAETIAELLHYNTSLFMWSAGAPAFLFFWPATLIVGAEGYDMYKTNKKIDELAKRACIDKNSPALTILPFDHVDRFIFIERAAYLPAFELKLYSNTDKKFINFEILLDTNLGIAESKL